MLTGVPAVLDQRPYQAGNGCSPSDSLRRGKKSGDCAKQLRDLVTKLARANSSSFLRDPRNLRGNAQVAVLFNLAQNARITTR